MTTKAEIARLKPLNTWLQAHVRRGQYHNEYRKCPDPSKCPTSTCRPLQRPTFLDDVPPLRFQCGGIPHALATSVNFLMFGPQVHLRMRPIVRRIALQTNPLRRRRTSLSKSDVRRMPTRPRRSPKIKYSAAKMFAGLLIAASVRSHVVSTLGAIRTRLHSRLSCPRRTRFSSVVTKLSQ